MGQDHRTTYYKRLGWPYTGDILDQKCKKCGDATTHTKQGWYTKDCKPVAIPDQWANHDGSPYTPFPVDWREEDVTLIKPWNVRESLKNYPPTTKEEWEEHDRLVEKEE